ncbi:MAG TPA: DsbA family protein [Pararobbsia sp.]|nr:DsbA family protein [Pararobbsia sp.]
MRQNHLVNVDVWIDYVCPYSFLHTCTIEEVRHVYGSNLHVRWHPLEIRPEPAVQPMPDVAEVQRVWDEVLYPLAFERGVEISMPKRIARSHLAFETAHWATEHAIFECVHRSIFEGYFRRGEDIEDIEVLANIAQACDGHGADLRRALDVRAYRDTVARHIGFGRRIGASGVPFTLLSRPAATSELARAPVALRGVAPLSHFHMAVATLFPEGFDANEHEATIARSSSHPRRDFKLIHEVNAR